MNALSLCSGIGGIERGLKRVITDYRTVAYCEADPFCQDVLIRRMQDGWLDRAPIWPDLRTLDGRPWRGRVDLVCAGFPCQPFSVSGKRRGDGDARNLWPDVRRVIAESEPAVVFLENVPGSLPYFYHVVLPELSGLGYAAQAGLFTAAEVGAPHRRQRIFVVAYRNVTGRQQVSRGPSGDEAADGRARWDTREQDGNYVASGGVENMGDAARPRREASRFGRDEHTGHPDEPRLALGFQPEVGCGALRDEGTPAWPPGPEERDRWAAVLARWPHLAPAVEDAARDWQQGAHGQYRRRERVPEAGTDRDGQEAPQPTIRRVADGAARRVDRLRALGNAVVPAQAARAFVMLWNQR